MVDLNFFKHYNRTFFKIPLFKMLFSRALDIDAFTLLPMIQYTFMPKLPANTPTSKFKLVEPTQPHTNSSTLPHTKTHRLAPAPKIHTDRHRHHSPLGLLVNFSVF